MEQKTRSHFGITFEKVKPINIFEIIGALVFAFTISLLNEKFILVSIGAVMGGTIVVGTEEILAFLKKKLKNSY